MNKATADREATWVERSVRARRAMDDAGYNELGLALQMGRTEHYVRNQLHGRGAISMVFLAHVAQVCGVSYEWLMTGSDVFGPSDDPIEIATVHEGTDRS